MNKKQQDVIRIAQKGGNDATLLVLEKLHTVEDELNTHKEEMAKEMQTLETELDTKIENLKKDLPNLDKVLESVKGVQGIQGEKGDTGETPDENKLIELIMPLIPDPIKGDKGKDGKDGKNGIDGINGVDGKNGIDGKDGSPDTPDQITDKLNTLEEKIEMKVIKGLVEEIKRLENKISSKNLGSVGPSRIYKRLTGQSFVETANGERTKFTLPKNTILNDTVAIFQNGSRRSSGSSKDYTISGKIVTFNFTPQSSDELLIDFEYY